MGDDLRDNEADEGFEDDYGDVNRFLEDLPSLGEFEVVRSSDAEVPTGQHVQLVYDPDDRRNVYLARLPERRVFASLNSYDSRWRWGRDGLECGTLDTYRFTLRSLSPEPFTDDLGAKLDEVRAPVMAEMRHELGLPVQGNDSFACLTCGRVASVVATHDRLRALLIEAHMGWLTWRELIAELDRGTPRIVPGWLQMNDLYGSSDLEFEEAVEILDGLVGRHIMERRENGYVPAPPRCARCMPAVEQDGDDE